MNKTGGSGMVLRLVLAGQMALAGPVPTRAADTADEATAVHVLNRMTFGPSPQDLAAIRKAGVRAWIDAQLRPSAKADTALATRLAPLETLAMGTAELREKYEIPPNIRQQIQKARADKDAAEGKNGAGDPGERFEQMTPQERRKEREEMTKKFPELAKLEGTPQRVLAELQAGKVVRATYAERQLDEVVADFWFNHFNVFARKGPVEFMVGDHERAIRERSFGKFEDLLVAVAKSPAMLYYLDNWQSTDPNYSPREAARQQRMAGRGRPGNPQRMGDMMGGNPQPRAGNARPGQPGQAGQPGQPPRRTYGINENYARELMELHTLGVDGGYTQADVIEVAKAFTGWTILGEGPGGPRRNKESHFAFTTAAHVKGDKKVLGVTVKDGGEREGLEILHLLATHPSTAKFIASKLARRFVADAPPKALVDRAAATFTKTGGDIREVLRTILTSDEFLGTTYRSAKVKTPLEFVVSAVRATGADVKNPRPLAEKISGMGMPLYLQQPPTGYKDTAEEWVSTTALLERMNFSLDLAAGRVRGVTVASSKTGDTLDTVAARLLPAGLSAKSRETLEAEAKKDPNDPAKLVGLVLGSPEFQRR